MPFPLKRLFTEENFKKIVESQRRWFVLSGKERDASILWHANLFSREDAAEEFQEFIMFTRENIANEVYSKSIMSVWSILMKKARRERLVEPAKMLLLLVINLETGNDTNWKKIKVKLLQRCGLVLMEPLKNHWRLFNGTRKLLKSEAFEEVKKIEDEEVWVDESVDEIINYLLENVGDKETVIRWSVAKGMARIVYRLPFNMANQILTCLVDIFTFSEPSVYQCHLLHGLCLTFAQLLHRGLVPKIFLDKILIIVCEALGFELNPMIHGMNGQNVRDAAAYACWTASRCFQGHEDVYAKFDGLINKLVCVSLLDREVQVRRACSAAFQEWVGRTASVTNGISLMSIMDYFSVGNRVNSFQNASKEVFQFEEYRIPLIEYAFEKQLFHWDVKTRELMASSLSNWLNIDNKFLINKIEYLIEKAKNCNEMAVFHGCILGLSQIGNLQIEKVFDFVDSIDIFNDSYFVDFSSEIICSSFCVLIKNIFEWLPTKNTKSSDSTKNIERYLEFIKKMLERKENVIHEAAADCLSALIKFLNPHEEFIEMLLKGLEKEDPVKRSAYSIALGGLPLKEINNDSISDKIIDGLLRASLFESTIQFNAEAKRNALNSINKLINQINLNARKLILKNIALNLNDYTIDSRGDVGSFVRLEAMQILINHRSIINPTDSNFYEILNLVIRQSVDKIDKVREKALETLNCLSMLQFDECEFLRLNLCGDWHFNIVQLFTIPKFQYSLLLGLTINAGYFGDMNDDLKILINFIKENASIPWMNILEQILEDHCKKDRIVTPFLNSVEHILSVIKPSVKLVELIQKEMLSKDSKKLLLYRLIKIFKKLIQQ
ncbi:ARM repeat-containing protein [Rozella allomycis CSF55]|uniref:ARM repeat-containing protein n=1 Tax=Rozella allomycis (strain CSF55) TaxID=988480 RepID=A0A4P9YPI6_ROZAC|nr:ARM repeat-containing protein [Rozella allomycis CSF55]